MNSGHTDINSIQTDTESSEFRQYLNKNLILLNGAKSFSKQINQAFLEFSKENPLYSANNFNLDQSTAQLIPLPNHFLISELSLHLECSTQIVEKGFELIGELLSFLPSIHNLSLQFLNCYKIGKISTFKLSSGISKLIDLQDFSLQFLQTRNNLSDESYEDMSEIFKHQPNIKKLKLCLGDYMSSDKGYQLFLDSLLNLKTISHFTYINRSFNNYFKLVDSQMLAQRLQFLSSLEYLNIYVDSYNGFDQHAASAISIAISKLINLKHFTMSMQNNQIRYQGISSISNSIKILSQLLTLDLVISSDLTKSGVEELCNSISLHRQLTDLRLNFRHVYGLGNDGTSSLAKGITQLDQLTCLELLLRDCGIQLEGAKILAKGIGMLTVLKKFKLINSDWFENEGYTELFINLKNLIYLKSVEIHDVGKYWVNPYQHLSDYLSTEFASHNLIKLSVLPKNIDMILLTVQALLQLLNLIELKVHLIQTQDFDKDQVKEIVSKINQIKQLKVLLFGKFKLRPFLKSQLLKMKKNKLVTIINL